MSITLPLGQGIHFDIPASVYFDDPCPEPSLTQSIVKVLLERSPGHARLEHPRLSTAEQPVEEEAEKYDKVKAIGNAAHALLIGRGKELAVGDFDSWRTKEAKTFREYAEAKRLTPILIDHHSIAEKMVEAAIEQLLVTEHADAFRPDGGDGEVVLAWCEEGTWLRTMIDWKMRAGARCYDYKTTGLSCAPHAVEDRPGELGWDVQAAMHERGLDILDPDNIGRRKFFFINQENEPPYALTPIRISEADLTLGRKKLEAGLDIWRACVASGEWPLYSPATVLSHPRGYTEARWLEREVAMDTYRGHPSYRDTRRKIAARGGPMLTDLSGG